MTSLVAVLMAISYLVEKLWSQEELEELLHNTKDQVTLPSNIQDEVLEKIVVLLMTVNINETLATHSYLKPLDGHDNIYTSFQSVMILTSFVKLLLTTLVNMEHAQLLLELYHPDRKFLVVQVRSVPRMALGCFPHLGAIIGVGVACGVEKKVKMCDVLVSSKPGFNMENSHHEVKQSMHLNTYARCLLRESNGQRIHSENACRKVKWIFLK